MRVGTRRVALSALVMAVGFAGPTIASSHALTPEEVELEFQAQAPQVGYWKVRLKPGQGEKLTATMANIGDKAIDVISYPGNVETAVGGGIDISEANEKSTGTTRWIDYPKGRLTLAGGESLERSFTVAVPRDATPGDYTTAVALQNADPAVPKGSEGQIQFGQILRQVLTVNVRVPGPYKPSLTIDGPALLERPASSAVRIAVKNSGNQDLTPSWEGSVRDSAGIEVARASAKMGEFYAGTTSALDLNVEGFLEPGSYSVDATMRDPELSGPVVKLNMPLQVGEPPEAAGEDPNVVNSSQSWVPFAGGLVLLLLIIGGLYLLFRRRIRRSRGSSPAQQLGTLPPGTRVAGQGLPMSPPVGPMVSASVAALLPLIGSRLKGLTGDTDVVLNEMADLYPGKPGALSMASQLQEIPAVRETRSSAVLVSPPILDAVVERGKEGLPTLIAVEDPEGVARQIAGHFGAPGTSGAP